MRVLTVYPHPDDERFGPASVLARWVREGAELHGVWFTRGEHGAAVHDLRDETALIGYRSVEVLSHGDGTLESDSDLARLVLSRLRELQPDVVVTSDPAGSTRYPDHIAVQRATARAFLRAQGEGVPIRELYCDAPYLMNVPAA